MEGRKVFLYKNMFDSVAMAESFIQYKIDNAQAELGVNDTTCTKSYAQMLCAEYLPACDSQLSAPVKMCMSTCQKLTATCAGMMNVTHQLNLGCNTSKPVIGLVVANSDTDGKCGYKNTSDVTKSYRTANQITAGSVSLSLSLGGLTEGSWTSSMEASVKALVTSKLTTHCGPTGTQCGTSDISSFSINWGDWRRGSGATTSTTVATADAAAAADAASTLNNYVNSGAAQADLQAAGVPATSASGSSSDTSSNNNTSGDSTGWETAIIVVACVAAVAAIGLAVGVAVTQNKKKTPSTQQGAVTTELEVDAAAEEAKDMEAPTMGSAGVVATETEGTI